jgi:hypothetical protein
MKLSAVFVLVVEYGGGGVKSCKAAIVVIKAVITLNVAIVNRLS